MTRVIRLAERAAKSNIPVLIEGESGVVEDVRLTSTWLRTAADARIIVPNERLAAGVLRNDSIGEKDVPVEASLWLHRDQDVVAAMDALRAGLELEAGTSPPVLRRIAGFERSATVPERAVMPAVTLCAAPLTVDTKPVATAVSAPSAR